jgi:hypothetical protein
MPEDLVDRIARERREKEQSRTREQELALRRSMAIEQNSDYLWLEIIKAARATIEKFNKTFPERDHVSISERAGSPPQGFDVNRQAYPIVTLNVWRNSRLFTEWTVTRLNAPFESPQEASGRIDIKADDDGNVYCKTNNGEVLASPHNVAEYLLGAVLT